MFDFIKKILTPSNEGEIKKLRKTVDKINALEPEIKKLSDEGMREKLQALKQQAQSGTSLDDLLPETFALVREAGVRVLNQRAFDVQLIGGIVLHQGRIAEMRTGEGKTLTATLPAVLNALTGKGVHVVTVNDYLAKFQSEMMGKIYRFLGLSVGLIVHDLSPEERQAAYNSDITYGTNNEFGFDYLRDNMVTYKERMVQRELNFAIVDEVDSILIDEARTPLIISGQGEKSTELYSRANQFILTGLTEAKEDKDNKDGGLLVEGDYLRDEKDKTLSLTEQGVKKAERFFQVENLTDPENQELYHHILGALRAHKMMKRDVDYVVKDGQVVIVDEFTGRLMVGRRYSDGLHQAIEAKEGVKVERESKTLATITFQNYFRMYHKLSGMTGTAKTEEEEFNGIYKLDVVTIPTNRPMIREDMNDAVFITMKAKYAAIIEEIVKRHATGQPILVGTVSVEKSELLSKMLALRGVEHVVLNAKFHEKEAEIVAQAGKKGAVTIATNMAGRGTDILLGGNAEFMARKSMRQQEYDEEIIEEAIGFNENVSDEVKEARKVFRELLAKYEVETNAGHDEVVRLGGLHIIGTERHESRRIDNQLRGRAGRQGDPGSSQFVISFDDDQLRLFGSDRFKPMLEKLSGDGEEAIEFGIVSKQIENAQKRVESKNYDIRLHVLQYDDVMNQQREIIYGQRRPSRGRRGQSGYLGHRGSGGIPGPPVHRPRRREADLRRPQGQDQGGAGPGAGGPRRRALRPARADVGRGQPGHARIRARGPAGRGGPPLDGPHRRHDRAQGRHRPQGLRPAQPHRGVQARGLRHVRGDGPPDPGGHPAPPLLHRARPAHGAPPGGPAHRRQPRRAGGQARPQKVRRQGRPQRPLPLRQREEV